MTFQPTEADFVRANRDWYLRTLMRPRTLFGVVLIGGTLAGLESLQGWIGHGVPGVLAAGVLGAGLTSLVYLGIYLLMPRRAGRLYRQQASLQRPLSFGWDETGLSVRSANGAGLVPWSELHRWSDGREMLLFYLNDQLFYFLPHRALTAVQIEDLRAMAAAHGIPKF